MKLSLSIGMGLLLLLATAGCTEEEKPVVEQPVEFCKVDVEEVEQKIDELLSRMSLEEKVEQMHGLQTLPIEDLYHTADNRNLGIPGFRMVDGPRGVRAGNATAFPVGVARGATWDPELERRVGRAIGAEVAAKGGNVLLAPCMNNLRHPRWGRAQETYGEDVHHLGKMGAGFILGAQEHVLACAKHFAANSLDDNRFYVDVRMDERSLREVYLPHFSEAVREAKVASVMSAYNKLNGDYCAENLHLLSDILKGDWHFLGFVVSDWVLGTRSTEESAVAGLDIEMPSPVFYGQPLVEAVEEGRISELVIDDAVSRILRAKYCYKLDRGGPGIGPEVVESREHTDLAREVARKGMVLLKNEDGALPLDSDALSTLAVVGSLADLANIGDHGSSSVRPSYVITPLQGIRERAGAVEVIHLPGTPLTDEDRAVIAGADASLVVVGYTWEDEGEARDRDSVYLSDANRELILEVAAAGERVIVVLMGGGAVVVEDWLDQVDALLMAWYPGQEGGKAIAEVLFGDYNPSGRLPVTFVRSPDHLPPFDNELDATDYDYYHGYRLLDRDGNEPRFAFGFGLSYTRFDYLGLSLSNSRLSADGTIRARVKVANSGAVYGEETVQLYVSADDSLVERALKDLKAFCKIGLQPGETGEITLEVPVGKLAYFDTDSASWVVEQGGYTVLVGPSSAELPLQSSLTVTD